MKVNRIRQESEDISKSNHNTVIAYSSTYKLATKVDMMCCVKEARNCDDGESLDVDPVSGGQCFTQKRKLGEETLVGERINQNYVRCL